MSEKRSKYRQRRVLYFTAMKVMLDLVLSEPMALTLAGSLKLHPSQSVRVCMHICVCVCVCVCGWVCVCVCVCVKKGGRGVLHVHVNTANVTARLHSLRLLSLNCVHMRARPSRPFISLTESSVAHYSGLPTALCISSPVDNIPPVYK